MTTERTPRQSCARDSRVAAHGALCDRCWRQLAEAVKDLPDLIATFSETTLETGSRESDEAKRSKVTGSPALIRLDVMVASGWGGLGAGDGVMPVWGTLDRWAGIAAPRLNLPVPEKGDTLRFLTRWLDAIAADREMAPEFWRDIRDLWNMLRRITNAPKPIGRCFGWDPQHPCGEPLYQPEPRPPAPGRRPPQLVIKCPRIACGRTYREADIVKLRIQHEREESA